MGLLPYLSDKNPKTNCPIPAAIMKTVKVMNGISFDYQSPEKCGGNI